MMCTGLEIASIAAMVGGAYMQNEAANDASDRQSRMISDQLEEQDRMSQRAEQTTLENAKQYDPKTRIARYLDAGEAAGDTLVADLTASREQQGLSGEKSDRAAGRLSEAFTTGKAAAAADEYQRSVDMARRMGKMRGAGDMMLDESLNNAEYALDGGMIGSEAARKYRVAQAGISGVRPDNSALMVGGLLQGAGSAGLSSAGKLSSSGTGMGSKSVAAGKIGSGTYGLWPK